MKKIGNIDISFRDYVAGIYYYNVNITVGDQCRSVILPRYDTFLGWIEVFGLPPQNEWVVLDTMNHFTKSAVLTIDNKEIDESIKYVPSENTHTIQTTRRYKDVEEISTWTQDYSNAPESILSKIVFVHSEGEYQSDWETAVLSNKESLTSAELSFVAEIENKYGIPDVLIKKTFTSSGVLPPLYYEMFPIQELINLNQSSGSVIELGYLKKESSHKIDNLHGDWYKKFNFGEKEFYINESKYTSCDYKTSSGVERIKDTYRKELFTA